MSVEDDKKDQELVHRAAEGLIEHFDTVQIFVTRQDQALAGGTQSYNYGRGNWFARYGQVVTWCSRQDEDDRETERRSRRDADEDD